MEEELNSKELEIAQVAFDAYNVQAGGKTWDGKDIPPFSEVGDKVRANWCAAVRAVTAHVGRADACCADGVEAGCASEPAA
jgi:hypothetical protein